MFELRAVSGLDSVNLVFKLHYFLDLLWFKSFKPIVDKAVSKKKKN